MGLGLFELLAVFTGASSMTQAENRSKRSIELLEEQTAMQRERHKREAAVWRAEDHRREMEALRLRQEWEREKAQKAQEFYSENTHGERFRVYENNVATVLHALVGRVLNARAFDDGRKRGYAITEGTDCESVRVLTEAEFRQRYRRWVDAHDGGSNELPPAPWTSNPKWVSPKVAASAPQSVPALPHRTALPAWDAALIEGRAAGPTVKVRPRLGVDASGLGAEKEFEATPVRSEGHRSYIVHGTKGGAYVEVAPSEYARDWIEDAASVTTAAVPKASPKAGAPPARSKGSATLANSKAAVPKAPQKRQLQKARSGKPPIVAAAPPVVVPPSPLRAVLQQDAGEALDDLRRWRLRQTERLVVRLVGQAGLTPPLARSIDGAYRATTPSGAATLSISGDRATVAWPDGSEIRDARVEREGHWVRLLGGSLCEGGTVRAMLTEEALQVGTLDAHGGITLHGDSSATRFVRG